MLGFVYNFGLSLLTSSWKLEDVQASDSKRLANIEKVFTNHVKTNPEYSWIGQYPSAIYSQAFRNLGKAIERWRKGEFGFPRMKGKLRKEPRAIVINS